MSLIELLSGLKHTYEVSRDYVLGHRELPDTNKACPCLSDQSLNLIRAII
jgi:hypothetical protein